MLANTGKAEKTDCSVYFREIGLSGLGGADGGRGEVSPPVSGATGGLGKRQAGRSRRADQVAGRDVNAALNLAAIAASAPVSPCGAPVGEFDISPILTRS